MLRTPTILRRLNFQFIMNESNNKCRRMLVLLVWCVPCMCVCMFGCLCVRCAHSHMAAITLKLYICLHVPSNQLIRSIWQHFIQNLPRIGNAAYPMRVTKFQCGKFGTHANAQQCVSAWAKNDLFTFCVWRFTCQLTVCSAQFCKCQSEYMSRFV